jgi:phosphoribosylanthranilate isomerase
MNVMVKICGITTREALDAALAAGADAIGFVFHAASPRNLTPARAAALAARVPPGVKTVAVTLHPSRAQAEEVLSSFVPQVWQTDARDFAAISLPAHIELWPVLRAGEALPPVLPRRLLYEGARSGAGELADWSQAAALATRTEVILGGGLTPANVAAAVRAVRPWGVDVSSGVESAPGSKDPARIREFVTAARDAAAGVGG